MIDSVAGCSYCPAQRATTNREGLDLFIAGAQKAGTTSFLYYLRQHSAIVGHDQKEFTFFSRDDQYARGYDDIYKDYYPEGLPGKKIVLAKSVAVMFIAESARRLHAHNPSCRVLTILRDPIERAYSAYWYMRQQGWETASTFEEALSLEEERIQERGELARHCSYVERGLYSPQLKHLYSLFGRENVFSVSFDRFKSSPQDVCSEVFEWVGLSDTEITPRRQHNRGQQPVFPTIQVLLRSFKESRVFDALASAAERVSPALVGNGLFESVEAVNKTALEKPPMKEATRARLAERFRDDVRETERLTGIRADGWLSTRRGEERVRKGGQ
jgi:hypothetical protein